MTKHRVKSPGARAAVALLPLAAILLPSPGRGVSACSTASCGACTPPAGFGISTLVDAADLPNGGASAFTAYIDPDDGTDRRFLVTQEGVIWTYRAASDNVLPTPFLDISAKVLFPGGNGESGLVSMAVSPDYAADGEFYVYYSQDLAGTADDDHMVIERYTRSANPDVANTTATPILIIEHPATNHNGGTLAFGPDGFLYVSTGDGGGGCDSQGPNAQRTDRLQGKILRLDVAGVDPNAVAPDDCARGGLAGAGDYEVPSGNPFVGQEPACDEIWSLGLRNPFRMSFDRETGDIFFGDVGQGAWEEINFLRAGIAAPQNFGWKCREGCQTTTCSNGANDFCPDTLTPGVTACAYGADIDTTANTFFVYDPILCHSNSPWASIMGGFMYRGNEVPALADRYFYSDYFCGQLWVTSSFDRQNPAAAASTCWEDTGNGISGFGEDHLGEVYIVRGGDQRIDCIHDGGAAGCDWAADPGIFGDDFESHDTSRWDATVTGP